MPRWALLSLAAMGFYAVGEYFSKRYADSGQMRLFLFAMVGYVVCTTLWFPSLKNNNNLTLMTITWTVGYAVIGALIGLLVFHEPLTRIQWVGMALGFVSLLLITR